MKMESLVDLLANNYHEDRFPELVYAIEMFILAGKISDKWVAAYNKYCATNKPGTDDFSYNELGDVFLEEIGGSQIFDKIN